MLLVDLASKSLLLFLVFMSFVRLLKNVTGEIRYNYWKLAFICIALIPVLSLILPTLDIPVIQGVHQEETLDLYTNSRKLPSTGSALESVDNTNTRITGTADDLTSEKEQQFYLNTSDLLLIIWLVGTGITMVFILAGFRHLSQLRKKAAEVSDKDVLDIVKAHERKIGISKRIVVLSTANVAVPITWGWRTNYILLPEDYLSWSHNKLEINLIHELEHIRRFDFPWNFFINACCAFYWFNPLVWLCSSLYRIERERSIDELIVDNGVSAPDYAFHLMETATYISGEKLILRSPLAVSKASRIKERVISVLNIGKEVKDISRIRKAFFAIVLLLATLPISALNIWQNKSNSELFRDQLLSSLDASVFDRTNLPEMMTKYRQGFVLMQNSQFNEAEPLFLDVLNELPFSVPSMFLLEAIYSETGQHQKRLEMNARRLNLRPKSDWYLFYLIALSYEELSEIDRAFHWIYRSLESNPHGIEYLPTLDEFKKLSKHPQWERLKSSWNKKNFEKVRNEYINPDYNAIINYPFPEPVEHKDFDHFVYIALTDGDYLLRIVALEMIVATGNPKGLDVVLEVLRIEVDPDVLERGIYALLGVPYENLTERLIQFCADTDNPWIDTFAGYVIGIDKPEVAAGILRDAVFTPAPHECHEDAVRMLGQLEKRAGEDALNYIINNHPSLSIRNAAGVALKSIR